ncbi:MAG: hypothetical protein KJO85_00150 [Gammaproteobacteria bacterium]|nr:hypothetical protein [Gammaproteobacteria bacterium]
MNKVLSTAAVLLTLALLGSSLAMAATVEKRVIAIKTNDFELAETDVSHLAVGEAETVVTEGGKTIDILRSAEGMEIYVDGELLEMSFGEGEEAAAHRHHERKVIRCDSDQGECDHVEIEEFIEADGDIRLIRAHDADHDIHFEDGETHESHKVIILRKEIEEES